MEPTLTLIRDDMSNKLLLYAEIMGKRLTDVVKRMAKGVTRRVIAITPPGSQGTTGAAAYRQGRTRIARQMSAVLAPVKLKGQRKVTSVFGRKLAAPVIVPTKERHPDVATLYRNQLRTDKSGRLKLNNFRGQKFYVDVRKFKAVLAARQARVGSLAAGFSSAAAALDVPLQNWVSRHGRAGGNISLDLAGAAMRITVRNFAPSLPAPLRAETQRRIEYAITYQQAAMERECSFVAFKTAQELAIKTRNFSALVPAGMMGGDDSA